ncbi:FecR family protein [Pedobacter lithocola]|uniref:FecR family protein n=1 Tax=Pedobacter lithocola TaxID=1908239 RepID=A0ABV8P7Z4_9SPHI
MDKEFTDEYLEKLAFRFKEGLLTPQEQMDFDVWYQMQVEKELNLSESEIDNEEQLEAKLYHSILRRLELKRAKNIQKRYKLFPHIAVAASVLMVVMASTFFYYIKTQGLVNKMAVADDIKPGRNGATLTLANGQKIHITETLNGRIAAQSGVVISKSNKGEIVYDISGTKTESVEYNILETSRGEQTKLRLPDGSLVFLNASSTLRFPASFTNMKRRIVELSGEGYFEIAKDKNHPFIVKTDLQQVEVLGTQFNINSYKDEPDLRTALVEGSIKLTTQKMNVTLRPGQQAVLRDSKINIRIADTDQIIAWKNNEFVFKGDDFRANMRKISRWYDIDVIYEPNAPDNFMLGGFLSQSRSLSEVLKLLENTDKVHFRREGRKVYVSR